jgi:hypothetical protein
MLSNTYSTVLLHLSSHVVLVAVLSCKIFDEAWRHRRRERTTRDHARVRSSLGLAAFRSMMSCTELSRAFGAFDHFFHSQWSSYSHLIDQVLLLLSRCSAHHGMSTKDVGLLVSHDEF